MDIFAVVDKTVINLSADILFDPQIQVVIVSRCFIILFCGRIAVRPFLFDVHRDKIKELTRHGGERGGQYVLGLTHSIRAAQGDWQLTT